MTKQAKERSILDEINARGCKKLRESHERRFMRGIVFAALLGLVFWGAWFWILNG